MPSISLTVQITGVDDAIVKARELAAAIQKAKSLADDLALALNDLEVNVEL